MASMDYKKPLIRCFIILIAAYYTVDFTEACGGCFSYAQTQSVCQQPIRVKTTESYMCYDISRMFKMPWKINQARPCYRTKYKTIGVKKTCCRGSSRIDEDTCRSCGHSVYSPWSSTDRVKPHYLIVGGTNAKPHQFPWLVRLMMRRGKTSWSFCGGTILASRWILTAAHCVHGSNSLESIVYAGDHNRLTKEPREQQLSIEEMYTYPGFAVGAVSPNDIALIKTTSDMTFNGFVEPACLPSREYNFVGKSVTIAGWGSIDGGYSASSLPAVLQHTEVKILGKDCRWSRQTFPNLLCAEGRGSNLCFGDSGGPMTIESYGQTTVIGVGWFTVAGCSPGEDFGYTAVGPYLEWIHAKIGY